MKFTCFIGIDVSKATLDVACCHQDNPNQFSYQQFNNNLSGFKSLLKWLSKQKADSQASLFCMERPLYIGSLLLFAGQPLGLHPCQSDTFEEVTGYHSWQK
jgi:hypothetical protein